MVAGPTACGKTSWIARLLKHRQVAFTDRITDILFVYSVWQPAYDQMEKDIPGIRFINRMLSAQEIDDFAPNDGAHRLLILDDQLPHLSECKHLVDIFSVLCHHRKISTFMLIQNVFAKCSWLRDAALNSQALVLFRNPRCSVQTACLATQMFPNNRKFFLDAFDKACSQPFSNLIVDLNPRTDTKLQLRSRVLPGEGPPIVYLPKFN